MPKADIRGSSRYGDVRALQCVPAPVNSFDTFVVSFLNCNLFFLRNSHFRQLGRARSHSTESFPAVFLLFLGAAFDIPVAGFLLGSVRTLEVSVSLLSSGGGMVRLVAFSALAFATCLAFGMSGTAVATSASTAATLPALERILPQSTVRPVDCRTYRHCGRIRSRAGEGAQRGRQDDARHHGGNGFESRQCISGTRPIEI